MSKDLSTSTPDTKPKKKSNLLIFTIILFIIFSLSIFSWWYLTAFQQAAGKTISYFYQTSKEIKNHQIKSDENRTNILLLGLDEIGQVREGSLLTDTIIIISISSSGSINLIPLPRDLWINSLKTKINAIYYYGELSNQTTGSQLTQKITQDITGLPIHYFLILKLETVKSVIDAMEGINVDVQQSFIDTQYPRDDADPTATDPAKLYETIEFYQGTQHMDGATALKFIRSRKSQDESEGTDTARSNRQQQVINAIIAQVKSFKIIINPYALGSLYSLWNQQIQTNLSDKDILSLTKQLSQNGLDISTIQIPIKDKDSDGILINPPIYKYNQWVYEPLDFTWNQLHQFVKTSLKDVK